MNQEDLSYSSYNNKNKNPKQIRKRQKNPPVLTVFCLIPLPFTQPSNSQQVLINLAHAAEANIEDSSFSRVAKIIKYCSGQVAKTRPSMLLIYLPGMSNPKAEGIKGQSICKETEFLKDKTPYRNRKYRTACFLPTFERDNKQKRHDR